MATSRGRPSSTKASISQDIQDEIDQMFGAQKAKWEAAFQALKNNGTSTLNDFRTLFRKIINDTTDWDDSLQDIYIKFEKIQKQTSEIFTNEKKAARALGEYNDVGKQILNHKIEERILSSDELKDIKEKLHKKAQDLVLAGRLLNKEREISKDVRERLKWLDEEIKKRERIEKALGLTGKLLKGISKIPILGDLLDTDKALKAAEKAANAGAGSLKVMDTALVSLGQSFISNLTSPAALLGLLIGLFKELIDLGFKYDKILTQNAKTLNISKETADIITKRFVEQNSSQVLLNKNLSKVFFTLTNQAQALEELNKLYGTAVYFSDRQVQDQIYITKQLGLQGEEAEGFSRLMITNKMTADEVLSSVVKQTVSLAKQTGIQLNNKKVLSEVTKVSGQLQANYKNNPDLIAKAVVQAQKLGMTLEQTSRSARSLLNFEESIENQIAAELVTGKQLNIEKARLLALNGDMAGAMDELLSKNVTYAEFQDMNIIQQDLLAKALGTTSDELANSLLHQQQLNDLGEQNKKLIEDRVAQLKKEGRETEANRLMNSLASKEEAKKSLREIDLQTQFNQLVLSYKEILVGILGGPMQQVLQKVMKWLNNSENVNKLTKAIQSILTGVAKMIQFIADHFEGIKMAAIALAAVIGIRFVGGLVQSLRLLGLMRGSMAGMAGPAAAGGMAGPVVTGGMASTGMYNGKPVFTGPKGGQYTVSASGKNVYLPKGANIQPMTPVASQSFGSKFGQNFRGGAAVASGVISGGITGFSEYQEQIAKGKSKSEAAGRGAFKGLGAGLGAAGGLALGAALAPATGGLSLLIPLVASGIGAWAGGELTDIDNYQKENTQTTNQAGNDLDAMLKEQQKTNNYLLENNRMTAAMAGKSSDIYYDSYKAGIAADVNTYQISSNYIP